MALYPCNNAAGLWAFRNLLMKQRIHHSQWLKMVTTDKIVAQMNAFNKESRSKLRQVLGLKKTRRERRYGQTLKKPQRARK
jgi:hypothetical protein